MSIGSEKLSGWRISTVASVWGLSLFGVLQIQYLTLDANHSVCGPWGCGPPLPPLLAYHGFWLVLLSLPTLLLCRSLEIWQLRKTGWLLLAIGLSGFVIVGVWEIIPSFPHWLLRVGDLEPRYYIHRYLLSLATLVDIPIAQITLAGFCCLLVTRTRGQQRPITSEPGSRVPV